MLLRWLLEKPVRLKLLMPVFGETPLDLFLLATSKHLILIIFLPVMVLSPPLAGHFQVNKLLLFKKICSQVEK